jgi:flagella basal body P-ring formation protein FlgA
LELRAEATVTGRDVKLKQVCRWSESQNRLFEPVAELVVGHLDEQRPFHTFSMEEIKEVLSGAGVNVAPICFSGATACTASRGDVKVDEGKALKEWIAAKTGQSNGGRASVRAGSDGERTLPLSPEYQGEGERGRGNPAPTGVKVGETLREVLTADLAQRLKISRDALQMEWAPQDEKLLNLSQGPVQFSVTGKRVRNLGNVSWEVALTAGESTQKVTVNANARAWQQQIVAAKSIASKQVIRDEDLAERKILVDLLSDEVMLSKAQAIGQQSAMEIKTGVVLNSRMVEAVPLVRMGQLVTVTIVQGGVQIKTAGRAVENGAYGQTIRVRNETTKDVYEVTITGPQTGVLGSTKSEPVALGS